MKFNKRVLVFLAIIAAIGGMAMTASAQRAGFRAAGIAPPQQQMQVGPITPVAPFTIAPVAPFVTAPVAPFVTAPVAPFGVAPGIGGIETFRAVAPATFFPPVQPPAIVTAPGFHHRNGFGNGFGTRTGNTVIINVPPTASVNIGLPVVSPIPPVLPTTVAPIPTTVLPIPPMIPAIQPGMSRAQVISQFGQPTVSIISSMGETLYFNGGATVVIQNGQVVTGAK